MSSRFDHLTKEQREALRARTLAGINAMTDEEAAEIDAGAVSDPDNPPDMLGRSTPVPPERAAVIRARAREAQATLSAAAGRGRRSPRRSSTSGSIATWWRSFARAAKAGRRA